jgi:hypothetical protein
MAHARVMHAGARRENRWKQLRNFVDSTLKKEVGKSKVNTVISVCTVIPVEGRASRHYALLPGRQTNLVHRPIWYTNQSGTQTNLVDRPIF